MKNFQNLPGDGWSPVSPAGVEYFWQWCEQEFSFSNFNFSSIKT
jgi:hypothetical protein